jgi:hypothetical protein
VKKIWVNKSRSFQEAEKFNRDYYLKMTPPQRLETMQLLREMYFKLKKGKHGGRKRLRRVIKVIK